MISVKSFPEARLNVILIWIGILKSPGKATIIGIPKSDNLHLALVLLPIPCSKLLTKWQRGYPHYSDDVICSYWYSPNVLLPQPDGTVYFCMYYNVKFDAYSMPCINEFPNGIDVACYWPTLDLTKFAFAKVKNNNNKKCYTPFGSQQFFTLLFKLPRTVTAGKANFFVIRIRISGWEILYGDCNPERETHSPASQIEINIWVFTDSSHLSSFS